MSVRHAVVAGRFYPGDTRELEREVQTLLADAAAQPTRCPKVLVVPHAGYVYSGRTAAKGFAQLSPWRDRIERVVVLGPSHQVGFKGVALSMADRFATPLGDVPLDHSCDEALLSLPQVTVLEDAHLYEHSLEVQLPFLQQQLTAFTLLPLVVGDADAEQVAEVLRTVWGGTETLIVISTDLSHYLNYDQARQLDGRTCQQIMALDYRALGHDQACGRNPLRGALKLAAQKGLSIQLLELCNSGDSEYGDQDRVVGYGAWALYE